MVRVRLGLSSVHTQLCGCCGTWSLLEGRFGSICQFPHIYEIMVPKCGSMLKWVKSNPCKNSKVKELLRFVNIGRVLLVWRKTSAHG